jgi:hypothetical protein
MFWFEFRTGFGFDISYDTLDSVDVDENGKADIENPKEATMIELLLPFCKVVGIIE